MTDFDYVSLQHEITVREAVAIAHRREIVTFVAGFLAGALIVWGAS